MSSGVQSDNLWVLRPKPNPRALIRLFCFPYAGGTANSFRPWAEALPASVEFCAVQPPGRGARMREPPFNNLPALIQACAPMILPYLDRSFAFFGHSMGALVSFELARFLRRERLREPLHLFLSGRRAAQRPASRPPTYDLPESEFLEHLHRLNGTPKEVLEHPQLMQLMLPLLRADFAVSQTYVYREEPRLDCPITAFGGEQDDEVSREDLEAWGAQTNASFSLRIFPGDHFFLHTSQTDLLGVLSRELNQLRGREASQVDVS